VELAAHQYVTAARRARVIIVAIATVHTTTTTALSFALPLPLPQDMEFSLYFLAFVDPAGESVVLLRNEECRAPRAISLAMWW
jgi:hypothetical protein